MNPSWIIGSKKVSPLSQASLGSPTGSQASVTKKREQKQRDKDDKPVKDAESAIEDVSPIEEGGDEAPNDKLKVTSAKLLQDIIRQGGDITKIEIDDKLWKNRVQYYNLNDPFNANQGKMPQTTLPPEDLKEDNEEEMKGQEDFSEDFGEEYEDQEPGTLPARLGWGGARIKGVHSMNTKTNQKKINPYPCMEDVMTTKQLFSGKMSKNVDCTHVVLELSEQLQEQVENLNLVAKNYPENLLGSHIYVYWKDDNKWYRAKIIKYLDISKRFKVVYDDEKEDKLAL